MRTKINAYAKYPVVQKLLHCNTVVVELMPPVRQLVS